jgi:hypothetical protein
VSGAETGVSTKRLLQSTAISIVMALVVLILFVLPAEYGVDVTGAGTALGLTRMAESTEQTPAGQAPALETLSVSEGPMRSDVMSVTLQPGEGAEVKAQMGAGETIVFDWVSEDGPVNFDMHGEPLGGSSTSYWADMEMESAAGVFTAPTDGTHGWFWRNRGEAPVEVTVRTSGFYERLFRAE